MTDFIDGEFFLFVEFDGVLLLFRREFRWSTTEPTSGSCRRETCLCSVGNDTAFKFSERTEDVKEDSG